MSESILDSYIGTYRATFKRNQTLTIYKRDGRLYADLSNGSGSNMLLVAQSETKFYLPDVAAVSTTFEFIVEKGKTIKLIATQDKEYEWEKIK